MNCVYCENPLPNKWYEFHCIPVARVDGKWIDMYNRLGELTVPIEHVAHWSCHMQDQAKKHTTPLDATNARDPQCRQDPTV